MQKTQLLNEYKWIASFLKDSSQLNDVKLLLSYYSEINKLLVNEKFDICNQFFSCIKVSELSDILLVGLLRLTCQWKTKIPLWSVLLDQSEKELSKRGYNSGVLLKGLFFI